MKSKRTTLTGGRGPGTPRLLTHTTSVSQHDKQAMLQRALRRRIAASMDLLARGLREPDRDDFEQLAYRFPELLEPVGQPFPQDVSGARCTICGQFTNDYDQCITQGCDGVTA